MKRSMILLLTLVALFLAACSSEGGGATASLTASADIEASDEPDSEATPGSDTEPTMQPGAGDLAGILPTEVGGITIEYESSSGEEVMGSEGMTPEAQEFFDRVGAEAGDLSSAFGVGFDAETGSGISIIAFRVAGADEGRLRDEFRRTLEQDGSDTQTLSDENVAGKNVIAISGGEGTEVSGYVYVKNDVVFVIGGSPASLAQEALEKLP